MRKKQTLSLSSNKALREFYGAYNYMYFGSRLPKNAILSFGIPPRDDSAYVDIRGKGDDRLIEIIIDERLKGMDCIVAQKIIHEMAHVDVDLTSPRVQHGPKFEKRMLELARAGAMEGIW